MNQQQQSLVDEIRQITRQYRAEVTGKRKAWPNAVKMRAITLRSQGLSFKAIADATGISYFTVLGWRDDTPVRRGKFKELVPISATATVTVTTPKG